MCAKGISVVSATRIKNVGGGSGNKKFCLMDVNLNEKALDLYQWKVTVHKIASWIGIGAINILSIFIHTIFIKLLNIQIIKIKNFNY